MPIPEPNAGESEEDFMGRCMEQVLGEGYEEDQALAICLGQIKSEKAMELKSYEITKSEVDLDERTFEGYASTWSEDQVGDVIHRGAFMKSISEAFPAKRIKVLWQHSEPLGMPIEMREDDYGLWVKAKVSKTRLGDEALELMRDGVIDRMSIGFSIPKGKADFDEKGVRHIREAKLMEFSPVTFPANEAAMITGVKNLRDAIEHGAQIQDVQQLVKALDDLKALIASLEPSTDTPIEDQPPELAELFDSVSSLGDFARNRLF